MYKIISVLLVFFTAAASVMAVTADDYKTGEPDPLIKNIPASIKSLKSGGAERYMNKVAEYILEHAVDEFDKVKKVHDWVALNIRYNTSAFFSGRIPSQNVANVVTTGLAVCAGYSEVFKYLCDLLDIECEIVSGYARGYGSSIFGSENPFSSNHAWNKVKVEGNWYLIDTTWDSGYVNSNRSFTAKYKTEYLFADPSIFINDHFPLNEANQLLTPPVTAEEFMKLPRIGEEFFNIVANLSPALKKITEVNGRFLRVDFTSPVNHHFMYNIYNSNGGGSLSGILNETVKDGVHTLTFHFQKTGKFRMWFYSSPKTTGTHQGIGEFGFDVNIPAVVWGTLPGGAELLFPETQIIARGTETEFRVEPGKYKYIVLINGSKWEYLSPDEYGVFKITSNLYNAGTYYLAASETETGVYDTLAVFTVK